MRRHPRPLLLAALAALAACAAPSRRLTPRVVQDAVTLPCGMASVAIEPSKTWYPLSGESPSSVRGGLRIGLTDELELTNVFSLKYAFLDDTRGSPRRRPPLSLAVQAGAEGLGYSSVEGPIALPVLRLELVRHVADTWKLALSLNWTGRWAEKPFKTAPGYDPSLSVSGNRSTLDIDLSVMRQLATRVAVELGAAAFQRQACLAPLCAWGVRGAGASLTLWVRPAHWITLGLAPGAGFRYRPAMLPEVQDPSQPVDVPPRSIGWFQLWGSIAFYW